MTNGTVMLLPPAPDRCQVCASQHEPEMPHNQQSLYYQMAFQMQHGRSPTWDDALAHCPPHIRNTWIDAMQSIASENPNKIKPADIPSKAPSEAVQAFDA